MSLIIIIIFIVFLLILFYRWYQYETSKITKFFNLLPAPPGLPFLGNAYHLKSTEEHLPFLQESIGKYGKRLKLQVGPLKRLMIGDYKDLEKVLNSSKLIEKSDEYNFLKPWLGTGLLTSGGQKWKSHRKMITPAFHFKILEYFIEVFNANSDILIKKLRNITEKNSINIFPIISMFTLDVICETSMGVKINAQQNDQSEYVKAVKNICQLVVSRIELTKCFDFIYQFTSDYRSEKRSLKILHDFTYSVIRKKQEDLKQQPSNKNDPDKRKNFLDLLLNTTCDGSLLTLEEIREEVDTFIFEGHDTTATAISFALHCLSENPNVQKKAFDEQMELFENNRNPKVTYNDLQNMRYLESIIKETLRLYPSVPVIGRKTTEDFDLNGLIVPKGVNIYISPYVVMRDPDYFSEPDKFMPERFETINGTLPFSYIPFSAGQRNCIGQKFATLELKSVISKIIRNFEILPAYPEKKIQIFCESVLTAKNGLHIQLKERL